MPYRILRHKKKEYTYEVSDDGNDMSSWRVKTFYTKEPWTVDWIETMQKGDIFWDVGANIGLYTIFAGKTECDSVFGFEPAFYNYNLLCRNTIHNRLQHKVTNYCVGLSNRNEVSKIYMPSIAKGSSGNQLHVKEKNKFKYKNTQGCMITTIDYLVDKYIPAPTYLKVDVDGIEPFVMQGAVYTLEKVKTICIETDTSNPAHNDCLEFIRSYGFKHDEGVRKKSMESRAGGHFANYAEFIFQR